MRRFRTPRRTFTRGNAMRRNVMVKHWFMASTINVPNGTTIQAPVVVDTEVYSLDLATQIPGIHRIASLWKGIKLLGMSYQFQYETTQLVSAVAAISVVSDALYQSGKTAAGTPQVSGLSFLHQNELSPDSDPALWPKRTFFRRLGMLNMGQTNAVPLTTHAQQTLPVKVKLNANLDTESSLWHRLELSNPTASAVTVVFQAMGALAFTSIP